jgi:signal peptidase
VTDRRRRAAHVLGILVVVAAVVPFVLYAVPQLAGADDSYVVLSGSMEPNVSRGDVVFVDRVAPDRVAAGDVITYRRTGDEKPTTHRVVRVVEPNETGPNGTVIGDGHAFVTKGDANEEADAQAVRGENVVGRVSLVFPYLGHLVLFANSTTGFLALVLLPIALLLASEVWRFARSPTSDAGAGGDGGTDGDRHGHGDDGATGGAPAVAHPGVARAAAAEGVALTPTALDSLDVPSDDDGPETLAVTRTDLRTTTVVLGLFAAYACWTAVNWFSGVTVGVAVATVTTFAMTAVLYLSTGVDDDATADAEPRDAGADGDDVESEPTVTVEESPDDAGGRDAVVVSDGGDPAREAAADDEDAGDAEDTWDVDDAEDLLASSLFARDLGTDDGGGDGE